MEFLGTALYLGDEDLFVRFLTWTEQILAARGVPTRSLPAALGLFARELKDFPRAVHLLERGSQTLTTDSPTDAGRHA